MQDFAYAHPTTRQDALSLLVSGGNSAAILAGGTDLISLMKEHVVTPQRVISIRGVKEWSGISVNDAGIRIGALVTIDELHEHPVMNAVPGLAFAVKEAASPQLRNMGTLGGNLCQRPRCWYFRNGFGLLARDKNGKSLVPGGENKYHAILGNDGPAYFVSPSTLVPAFIALDAKIKIAGKNGEREMALRDFYVIPKSDSDLEHALKPGEIVTEIMIPATYKNLRTATHEVRERDCFDWPLGTASVALKMNGDRVQSAMIVMGHVAPVPWIAEAAAKSLEGKAITAETAAAAGEAAVAGAKPLSQNTYKIQIARVCVKRALLEAARNSAQA